MASFFSKGVCPLHNEAAEAPEEETEPHMPHLHAGKAGRKGAKAPAGASPSRALAGRAEGAHRGN